jgi:hypothetical protein
MGTPIKLSVRGQSVFVCCAGCREEAIREADRTLERVHQKHTAEPEKSAPPKNELRAPEPHVASSSKEEQEIASELAKLSPADRLLAQKQRYCVISEESRLGSMGKPIKLMLGGETVFLCCEGCEEAAKAKAQDSAAKAKALRAKSTAPKK